MQRFIIGLFAFAALIVPIARASAQAVDRTERPRLHVPLRPPTQKQLDQLEALHLFARGVLCEREDRLLEAMRHYEAAAKLDPEAVTIHKSLLMIYIALERNDDAIQKLKKVLELDPHDFEMGFLHARQLRNRGQLDEACEVLRKGLQAPALHDRPDLHQQMEYDLGSLCERLGKFAEAGAAFCRAVAVFDQPDGNLRHRISAEEIQMGSAEMYERAGRNYLDAHDFPKATAAFQQAQAKFPAGAGRLYFHLAQVAVRQGKLNDALTALDEYLRLMPQGTDAYEMKAGLLQKLKRDAEIVPWLEQASAKDTFNVGLRVLLARQCAQFGDITRAEKIYRGMAETGPTEKVYYGLFSLYKDHHPRGAESIGEMLNDTFEAALRKDNPLANNPAPAQAKAMIAAIRENPALAREVLRSCVNLAQRKPLNIDTLQFFAAVAERFEMLPEAEVYYRECVKRSLPAATEPLIYGGMLSVLWKAQRLDALVEACRTGLKNAQPSNRVMLRISLAQALGQLQRWDEALAEADLALRDAAGGERFRSRLLRVRLLTGAGKSADAEAECQAMLKEHTLPGELLEVHYVLSGVYSSAKRGAQAEAELVACLKIDPDSAAINNDLGYLWADQNKNLPDAEAMIRKAIEVDRKTRQGMFSVGPKRDKEIKDNACYIDSLGWVLFRRGQVEAARKELEYAATLPEGDDPVIFEHLGEVYQTLGQREQALAAYRQALHYYDEGKRHKIEERYQALQERVRQLNTGKRR